MEKNYKATPGSWIGASARAEINTTPTNTQSDWDIDPSLNLLCLVGLDHRPEPKLTLPGRIGTSTRASKETPLSQIGSST